MFVHALSGAASFAACLRLFRSYPLAVSPWSGDGRHRWIVLRHPGDRREPDERGERLLHPEPGSGRPLRAAALGAARGRRVQRGHVPGNPAGRAGARRRPPGDRRGHAGPARRRAARLGQRPAGDGRVLGVPRAAARRLGRGTADQGAADGRQRPAALARVHRGPAGRRPALGLPRPGRAGRSRPGRRRGARLRVLGAVAEHAPRRPRDMAASSSGGTSRPTSSGCPPASTWTTGCSARASPRRRRSTCCPFPARRPGPAIRSCRARLTEILPQPAVNPVTH